MADANLAAYFSREILSETNATQSLSSSEKNKETLKRNITVKSYVDLHGIQHTKTWFDSKSKNYFVCAYVKRKEAFKDYENSLILENEKFYSLYNSAQKEKSPFKKISLLKESKVAGATYLNALDFAEVLYKEGCAAYSKDRSVVAAIDEKIATAKMNISMRVLFEESKNERYRPLLEKAVSDSGFLIANKNYSYLILAKINEDKSIFTDTIVANPKIAIQIKNDSETILSFSKSTERISGFKDAERLVDYKIQNEIEKTISEEFSEKIKELLEGSR